MAGRKKQSVKKCTTKFYYYTNVDQIDFWALDKSWKNDVRSNSSTHYKEMEFLNQINSFLKAEIYEHSYNENDVRAFIYNLKTADLSLLRHNTDRLSFEQECQLLFQIQPSEQWMLEQMKYIHALKPNDKLILIYYSNYEFSRELNHFLNVPDFPPMIPSSVLKNGDTIIDYIRNLDIIIENAPPLDKTVVLYQGTGKSLRDEYPKQNFGTFQMLTYCSAYMFQDIGLLYSQMKDHSKLAILVVPKGTKCVFLSPVNQQGPVEGKILFHREVTLTALTDQSRLQLIAQDPNSSSTAYTDLMFDVNRYEVTSKYNPISPTMYGFKC